MRSEGRHIAHVHIRKRAELLYFQKRFIQGKTPKVSKKENPVQTLFFCNALRTPLLRKDDGCNPDSNKPSATENSTDGKRDPEPLSAISHSSNE